MSKSDLQREITHSFLKFEGSLRKDHPFAWLMSLVSPFLVTAFILTVIGILYGVTMVRNVCLAAMATFFLLGRFVILFGSDMAPSAEIVGVKEAARALNSQELFLMVTYMDFMTALFVAFHIGPLFKLPWVGPKLAGLVADAQFILSIQPWMRRATFLGLVLFVIFPTSTTGSIGGSIFGRLLGLRRVSTLMAILTGSILGNGIMYFFAAQLRPLKEMLQDSIVAKVGGAIAVISLVVIIERCFRVMKKRYVANNETE